MTRLARTYIKYLPNIAIFAIILASVTCLDLVNHYILNGRYIFRLEALTFGSYFQAAGVILLACFSGVYFFRFFLGMTILAALCQVISFEYFGSYIAPFQILHFAPDFMLIMASLAEVIGEMIPLLVVCILVVLVGTALLRPLLIARQTSTAISLALILLLILNLALTHLVVAQNTSKISEYHSERLSPQPNVLGVQNAFRSLRYLTAGILPDLIQGNLPKITIVPTAQKIETPKVNIVLIIGETVRASNMSILGYDQKTTPHFDAMDGLLARTIYAAGTMTRSSFAGLFNRLDSAGLGRQTTGRANCLHYLARKNGFKTHFIYAYNQRAAETLLPFMCPGSVDVVAVQPNASVDPNDPDKNLFPAMENIDFTTPNFITLMPQGAHSPYGSRSPKSFKKFARNYDNAILFADHTVHRITQHLAQHSPLPTYVIYTGDHGEILKGEDENRGHGWFHREVVQVPFLYHTINVQTDPHRQQATMVKSHFDIATLLTRILGYNTTINTNRTRKIHINGSDVSGLAGQLILTLDGSDVVNVSATHTFATPPTPRALQIRQP